MLELIFITIMVLLVYQLIERKRHYEKYKEFYKTPVPKYYPIIGNGYFLMTNNVLKALVEQTRICGSPMLAYLPNRTYVTSEPEEIKIILTEALEKSEFYRTLHIIFKNTLLIAPVQQWKKNRKLMAKGFHQNILDSFVECFYSKSCNLVDVLKSNKYTDIIELFREFTLDNFVEATIGIKSSILGSEDNIVVKAMSRIQIIMIERIGNIFKMIDFIFSKLACGKENVKLTQVIHGFVQNVIDQKRSVNSDETTMFTTKGLPVLDLLLQVQKKENFTDEYILKEMSLFAAAAADTTANSMGYIFLMLGMHPDVQQKVYDEVVSVAGESAEICYYHLNKLKYTEMAINETMRIFPAVPIVARKVKEDLNIGNKVIPSNTQVVVNFFNMHRDEKIYPDPLVYDPNRFLTEATVKRHPFSFLPFSGGPRNCIGWKYAQMVIKIAVANVVRNFHITTKHKSPAEIELESTIVMVPTNPLDINFVPRWN